MLPRDLLCSPGRIAWEGDRHIDIYIDIYTSQLLDGIGPVGQFCENMNKIIIKNTQLLNFSNAFLNTLKYL